MARPSPRARRARGLVRGRRGLGRPPRADPGGVLTLTDEIARFVRDARLGFAATVSPDGTPNLSPKGTTLVRDAEHLVFADIASPQTVANLERNPAIEVNVVDVGTRRGYRFRGTARVVPLDDVLLAWYAEQGFDLAGRAARAVLVRVDDVAELRSPAYDWGESEEELLRTYVRHYATVWAARLGSGAPWPPEVYELHYLAADDPREQSGFRGDEARWEGARRPIVEAIDRDGAFLDVGCANGLLMESVVRWSRHRIEPYGLDHAPRLVELARRRLPQWADRIWVGDVLDWEPPRRFDFVRTELVYAAGPLRYDLVRRLLDRFLAPGGRLIVCSYGSLRSGLATERVGEILRDFGCRVDGELVREGPEGALVRLAWTGVPA